MSYQVFVQEKAKLTTKGKIGTGGWGPMWPLYQSRKLHSALSEIVSLVYGNTWQ